MPTPISRVTRVADSMVNRWISGFTTSTSVSGTSAPVTVFGPVTCIRRTLGAPEGTWIASFFRLSRTSTVLSLTPGIFVSALRTPSIRTHDTAAPGTMARSVRRRELPTGQRVPLHKGPRAEPAVPVAQNLPLDLLRLLKWNARHSLPYLESRLGP